MSSATVEQVVETIIDKRKEVEWSSFSDLVDSAYLLSVTGVDDSKKWMFESLKNGMLSLIWSVSSLFRPEISKLKKYFELHKNDALLLWVLKKEIEHQQKLNIELALQQANNNTVQNVHLKSRPVSNTFDHDDVDYNKSENSKLENSKLEDNKLEDNNEYDIDKYIWPYSLEYYEQMHTAHKLANIIAKKWPIRQSSKNYCGAGVRSLLTKYMWFSWFPTSWAHGKIRDTILEERVITTKEWKMVKFIKEKVKTPYEAKPWAVIPYEAYAELWTSARKQSGHVEIKWSDWKYYFDLKASMPWWSARVSFAEAQKMTAEEYRKKTWFQGYVYYPVIEGEIPAHWFW